MILIDLNQASIAAISVYPGDEFKVGNDGAIAKGLLKHMFFNMVLSYKKKYSQKFGEMVFAYDSNPYWRKEEFAWYKGHRKHDREKSDTDWGLIFESIDELRNDLIENFKYKVIGVPGAEADDVISSLCKYKDTNDLVKVGLFLSSPENSLILSSDNDFCQLQKYPGVHQYSPKLKKMLRVSNATEFLNEHIMEGDSGDNIPNCLTGDDWSKARAKGEKPPRQNQLRADRRKEFIELGINGCRNEEERINWLRNKQLIDFACIPDPIYNKIVEEYKNYEVKGSAMKIMKYFAAHKMKVHYSNAGEF